MESRSESTQSGAQLIETSNPDEVLFRGFVFLGEASFGVTRRGQKRCDGGQRSLGEARWFTPEQHHPYVEELRSKLVSYE
jgi:hypothetical protein